MAVEVRLGCCRCEPGRKCALDRVSAAESRIDSPLKVSSKICRTSRKSCRWNWQAETGAQKFTPCRGADARLNPQIDLEAAAVWQDRQRNLNSSLQTKGLDASKFQPYLAELRKVEAAPKRRLARWMGWACPSKATAAALRGVPAQFTDIVTALQSGQRPLTDADAAGRPVERHVWRRWCRRASALGGYVLGLINPFTIAAAAIGADCACL